MPLVLTIILHKKPTARIQLGLTVYFEQRKNRLLLPLGDEKAMMTKLSGLICNMIMAEEAYFSDQNGLMMRELMTSPVLISIFWPFCALLHTIYR